MTIELSALWLVFVLGLRHGLDPDHIAVIDNIVFRTIETRPRTAAWTGTLFALGHSLSVASVAVGAALLANAISLPAWSGAVVDLGVIALLLVIGSINLRDLLRQGDYAPRGWRAGLVPRSLRSTTHPMGVIGIGVIFGLVFDTATQAAAWGAAATAAGGPPAALAIAICFAAGMAIADTIDSQLVARLLRRAEHTPMRMQRFRRAVGWLVVALSYGTALLALFELAGGDAGLSATAFTAIGVAAAAVIVALLAIGQWRTRSAVSTAHLSD